MKSFKERIEGKYQVDENGCWLWTGNTKDGYARIEQRFGKGNQVDIKVHRAMVTTQVGPLPPWLYACHPCDVRRCINPDHLYVGTHQENMREVVDRDRHQGRRYAG